MIGGVITMTQRPHASASGMQRPQQALKPELQAMPQLVPSQVALPFSGTRHGSQRLPQVEVLESEAQALPQRWYASRHAKSQLMPIGVLVQAGTELAGPAGHGSQALPQVATS